VSHPLSQNPLLPDTIAAILAGGLGTRLRSIVPDKPKVLAQISGRAFIEYLLDQLAAAGITTVVLCVGYKGEMVQQHLGTDYRGMKLLYSQETTPLGTGGALRLALPLFNSESVLVMNGDSYCDANLGSFAAWHSAQHSPATLLLAQTDDTRRYGRVDEERGKIVSFQEKADTTGPGWVNAGLYLLSRQFIESIPAERVVSIEREVFPAWIGHGLHGFQSDGRLWDIGVPEAYASALKDFAKNLTP
jgi:D-glycero-alpha-D-manno-heptose 1-phosphate guanylyltransferase